ncbi:uncharacterized protein N7458_004006 [Penicillium daleae]|uniref:BTB domain-containing protein n=1 Tax=Penicillium daleae TaxID=63821 RepID=A0AAD6C9Q7_9EURO|nr:uncharacterized protein N7458_004006 [Penicillium daleae]KAJ5455742.1 hypothetical protein N7458_004006 [Penicillium daleae]
MEIVIEATHGLPTTVIDPDGDTILILSNRQYRSLFRCSSAKLVQNCGHFKKKLAQGGQPHTELMRDGTVYLTINEFEVNTIEIILNLIHGRIRNIPRNPRLPLLLDIARFCNYLQCLPTVKPFATSWIEKSKDSVLECTTIKPDTNSWIFISLVFRHQEVFRHTTAVTQQCLDNRMDVMRGHPLVPKDIISK